MNRSIKSHAGVTLLEIMLVLAIAAMVIVMSIRYYQNASNAENMNVILEEIQNITAAADNIAQASGGYSTVTSSTISVLAGSGNMKTPYGAQIKPVAVGGGTSYTVSYGTVPLNVCTGLTTRLLTNSKFTGLPTCSNATLFTYTYNASS